MRIELRVLLSLWFAACCALASGVASAAEPEEQRTLMLVREWNPETGELVGWLPIHRATMRLILLEHQTPRFDLNDAVTIDWLPRPNLSPTTGQVLVTPTPRVFEGESWVPTKRDANVVRIAKRLFLIRSIILGESKWRLPTQVALLPKGKNY